MEPTQQEPPKEPIMHPRSPNHPIYHQPRQPQAYLRPPAYWPPPALYQPAGLGVSAILFAFLLPILGILLGLAAMASPSPKNRSYGTCGVILGLFFGALWAVAITQLGS